MCTLWRSRRHNHSLKSLDHSIKSCKELILPPLKLKELGFLERESLRNLIEVFLIHCVSQNESSLNTRAYTPSRVSLGYSVTSRFVFVYFPRSPAQHCDLFPYVSLALLLECAIRSVSSYDSGQMLRFSSSISISSDRHCDSISSAPSPSCLGARFIGVNACTFHNRHCDSFSSASLALMLGQAI
ncbi:hypothetical protein CRG98_030594 [Punica granatum]|uniref:Uncharacterized protein n=1 Tax=Punica granatum TaxID=22663 RepID=A0A2I0IYC1_PUNGR|nr:hypothetical protein CRG98_030594 [Punica granatum]